MAVNKSLAVTSFMSEPDDTLATADVYEIKNDSVINNLPVIDSSPSAGLSAKLADGMRGGPSMLSSLPLKSDSALSGGWKVVDSAATKSSLFSMSSLQQVASTALKAAPGVLSLAGKAGLTSPSLLSKITGSGISGIPGLSQGNLGSLTSAIAGNQVPGSFKNSLNLPMGNSLGSTLSLGNTTTRLAPGNLTSAMQMTNLFGNLNPNGSVATPSFVDKDSSVRLISALSNAAMSSGITNGFSQSVGMAGGNKSIITQAASLALKSAASFGSVAGMKDVTSTYSSAVGSPTSLYASNPNVLTDLSSNYKKPLPLGTTTYNGPAVNPEFTDTIDTFGNINPSWNSTGRLTANGVENSLNLCTVANGNKEFQNMFMQGVRQSPDTGGTDSLKFMAMATQFPIESPEATLKKNFPMTVTSVQTVTTPVEPKSPTSEHGWGDDVDLAGDGYGDWRDMATLS